MVHLHLAPAAERLDRDVHLAAERAAPARSPHLVGHRVPARFERGHRRLDVGDDLAGASPRTGFDVVGALLHATRVLREDLADRGLLDSTLVIITGEFGRTPRVNKNAGRDHWGPAFTVALGGGGIPGGRVVGRTDARAERPASDPYGPEDLSATMFHLMGIDPKEEFHTPEGRPVAIVNGGRVIRELV